MSMFFCRFVMSSVSNVVNGVTLTQTERLAFWFKGVFYRLKLSNLLFWALALCRAYIHSDKGLTFKMLAFESLFGVQFTLSTHLIKSNYFVILPTNTETYRTFPFFQFTTFQYSPHLVLFLSISSVPYSTRVKMTMLIQVLLQVWTAPSFIRNSCSVCIFVAKEKHLTSKV